MKGDRMKKRIRIILIVILAIIVLILVAMLFAFRHELKTLSSLEEKSEGVYTMTYDGDYGFDEFLDTGAKSDADIEKYVTKRLMKGLPININSADPGCTAFVTRNEDGDVIYGRNFDFVYAPCLQLFTKPDNGYASVSTVNLSYAGYGKDNLPTEGISIGNFPVLAAPYLAFDGMNEKGVCMALLSVPEAQATDDPDKVTLNTTTAVRLVLDKAASVDEAVELLGEYNIYFSGGIASHYLIADATGKSVIVEYYDGGLQVVEPDEDYQIASNFSAHKGLNIGEGFTEFERYDADEEALQKNDNVLTMEQCEKLLNKIGIYDGDLDKLQWSVVYDPTDGTGRIWPHRDIDEAWNFELKQ